MVKNMERRKRYNTILFKEIYAEFKLEHIDGQIINQPMFEENTRKLAQRNVITIEKDEEI